jgi:hypothetical protein
MSKGILFLFLIFFESVNYIYSRREFLKKQIRIVTLSEVEG